MANITVTASCLCKALSFSTPPLPPSALPLKSSSCHCTSCRHVTGALRSSDAEWPGPPGEIQQALADAAGESGGKGAGLRRYRHSERVGVLFCGVCGAGLFFEERDEEAEGGVRYSVFTGALSGVVSEGEGEVPVLVRCEDHIFVGDTVDGGAVCWLRGMNGEGDEGPPVRVWLGARGASEEVPPGVRWPALESLLGYEVGLKTAEGDRGNVPVRCHCGGVDLVLRAGELQREFEEMQKKGEELPFLVDPVTHKMLASLDACESCRRCAGSELCNWTFSLLRHISFAAGDEAGGFPQSTAELKTAVEGTEGKRRDPRFGTLAFYISSPTVQRYFCGRCSAQVFYAVDSRPDLVDIAVGLLDSPDGARAESVLSWSFGGTTSWMQDMVGTWREPLWRAALKEVEEWRIARGYPKNWHRVAREQQAEQSGGK